MNYKLQDLIDLSAFNEMLESLAALYSFTSAIVDLDGKILLAIGWQDACTMFHRVHPDTAAECRKSDSYLNHHLNEAQPFVTYQCHNGLTDCAIPIIIGGEHLANFFTGQFFFEEPDLSFFKAQAERYGFESDRYLESIRKVPIWTKERLHQHMTVIRSFTDLLADLGTRKLKEMQARESAMQAGTALKQRELQLQRIFDTLLDGFVRTDRFGHIVLVSPSVVPLFGYTSESEMLGMAVSQLYADPDFRIEMLKQLEDSGKLVDVVTEGLRKDGTHFWISMNVQALLDETGRREGTEGIIRDITERKVAEQAYREISEMNRSLLDSIPFGFSIVDEKGYIRYVNDNLLHLSDEDPIGQSCTQFSSPEQNYCKICSLRKGIQVGETITFEGKWRDCDRLFLIHQTGMIYNGEKALMNIFLDITEKRAIEQRLNLLAHSLETISECVTITDTEDRIIYVNDSLLRTYGYSEKELIGQHVSVLRPDSVEFVKARELFMQAPDGSWRGELVNRRKDGSLFPILLSTAVLKDETGSAIALIGVAMDITEMHRYRQELFD
ncbi:MAG: PAS domain S-box protein, partial [Marinilabiliales bacterium]|nr:PAS domain S-box protein [Marinilabiliales bacterium]